ncbi:PH domain-containing protein [Bacillus sp. 1P06AnD]|uniref:PH domain-containing protein n=1 Tax=Bacillus sp. 1P06AnD TaxID=3132208 RepID=UPI0039A31540
MYLDIPEPTRRISKKAVAVWRLTGTLSFILWTFALSALLFFDHTYHWYDWIGIIIYIAIAINSLFGVYEIVFKPYYLHKTWRYEINEEFIHLKNGHLIEENTLLPMTKVEYVSTSQGPFLRKYHLYNVNIGTTASIHTIPAIMEEEAIALTHQIARYAKVKDEFEEEKAEHDERKA